MSTHENETVYQQARVTFLELCSQLKIDFANIKILDIGCGTGFYANIIQSQGGKDYLGIDITHVLFKEISPKFPEFNFRQLDITKEDVNGQFDLIIMIDVTQHIVENQAFSFAMQNVNSCLCKGGVFIVTSNLSESIGQLTPHVVERTMNCYKNEFPGATFSDPIPFRDKYIFSIVKKQASGSSGETNMD